MNFAGGGGGGGGEGKGGGDKFSNVHLCQEVINWAKMKNVKNKLVHLSRD